MQLHVFDYHGHYSLSLLVSQRPTFRPGKRLETLPPESAPAIFRLVQQQSGRWFVCHV
jgi:hypothetical protein